MVQFILDNLEVILLIYFFVNTFIAGMVFQDHRDEKWYESLYLIFWCILLSIPLSLLAFIDDLFNSLTRKLPLQAIWRLYFHPNLKKGVITQDQVNFANRMSKYHKNSDSLGDRIYRWYVGKVNKRFAKQNKERHESK